MLNRVPSRSRPQSFFIKTFGCQMNVADTEQMRSVLSEVGMQEADTPAEAELLLVNGCSVREKPVHKALSELGRHVRFTKRSTVQNSGPMIGLGGCVGQLEKDGIFDKQPALDFVFGPDTIGELPEMIDRVRRGHRHLTFTDFDRSRKYSTQTRLVKVRAQAFVNIMKGCDKFCTYCIVPFTRGREKSRIIDEVLDDLARLVVEGVREVTLLGQNVNSFGKGNPNQKNREPRTLQNRIGRVGPREGDENFPQLLRAIDRDPRLSDLRRVRFTSSHPLDFSDELIECYHPKTGVRKLAGHLHLPVQSGSDRVLKAMGRHHQILDYVAQMKRLREIRPEVGLSTDIIVGFPGETEEDFQQTLKLLEDVQYDSLYAFAYSERPGTKAARLIDDISPEEKNRRLSLVLERGKTLGKKRNGLKVDKIFEVLVEGEAKNQNLLQSSPRVGKVFSGRTECNSVVNFASPRDLTGKLVTVRVERATSLSLQGTLLLDAGDAESIDRKCS